MKAAALFLLLALAAAAQADRFVYFKLCKHRTGELVEHHDHDGFKTRGEAYVSTGLPVTLIPIKSVDCTLIEMRNGGKVSVAGTVREVHCKLRGGPDCPK